MKIDINKILRSNPKDCRRGAPLGDFNSVGSLKLLHLQKVKLCGDYGPDGTYWGSGYESVYCAFSVEGDTRLYVRAAGRYHAIREFKVGYPGITFRRY